MPLFRTLPFFGSDAVDCDFQVSLLLQHGLLSHTLQLAHNCLTFDFIGTSTDESSDDLCTVQIPTSWRTGQWKEWSGLGMK